MATDAKLTPNEKCCRTCLKEDSLMFDLFAERFESSNIADMLVSCTKLKIQKDDALPKQICRDCFKCLVSFSHFHIMAQKAEEKLISAILNTSEFNEKSSYGDFFEIKIENDDHDNNNDNDNDKIFESHNDIILDENINSEQYDTNISHNDCKVEEVKEEKKKLTCVYCNKHFSKLFKLTHHEEKKHLSKNEQKCKLCIETKPSKSTLLLTINEDPDLNVNNVSSSTAIESINLLSTHMKSHKDKDGILYSCKEYNEVYQKNSYPKQHEMIHNDQYAHIDSLNTKTPKENVNTNICEPNSDQFQCNKCLLTFKNINSLSAHMRKHTEKGRIISCKECNKVFKKLSHLKRHEIQHEINCPFKCNVCPKSFPTKDTYEDHVNKHRGVKPHVCPVCSKRFSHLSTLTTHIKIHTTDKMFKLCPTCGKKFDSSTNLNQHMLRHTGLKEFACTLCPKRFVSKGELKSHTVTHTGERSCTCDQCGATFTKRSSLTKHKIRHLGLKPHQCDTCLMRFTCKDHLKRHYRIHTGEKPYKCEICDRAFTQSNDLVKHRRSHLGDKVYKCPQCTEGFRLNAELRQHISEHFVSSQMHSMTDSKGLPTDGVGSYKPLTTVIGASNVDVSQTNS